MPDPVAPAAPAHLSGDEVDQRSGGDAIGRVLRHTGNEAHLPAIGGSEHHRGRAESALELIDHVAQLLGSDAIDAGREHREPPYVDRPRREILAMGCGEARAGAGELLLELAAARDDLLHPLHDRIALRIRQAGEPAEALVRAFQPVERGFSRERFHPAIPPRSRFPIRA